MNAIVEAFAFDEARKGGVNLDSVANGFEKYLQCAAVSLVSLKKKNPDDEVVFATNITLPDSFAALFANNGVSVWLVPFDDFVYPDSMEWGLAYYKLCVLKKVATQGSFDRILLCDTDVWCQKPLQSLWREMQGGGVYMIDLHADWESENRQSMIGDASVLFDLPFDKAICWGGEIIAGESSDLAVFSRNLTNTYRKTLEKGVFSRKGDEFLVFASQVEEPAIYPANAYAQRIWTGRHFTPCRHEELALLHLPGEKDHAFEKAYKALEGGGALPCGRTFLKWCGLTPSRRPFSLSWFFERGLSKAKAKFAKVG